MVKFFGKSTKQKAILENERQVIEKKRMPTKKLWPWKKEPSRIKGLCQINTLQMGKQRNLQFIFFNIVLIQFS